jgi:hypothetical protein
VSGYGFGESLTPVLELLNQLRNVARIKEKWAGSGTPAFERAETSPG